MSILSDIWIREQAQQHAMIEPFVEAQRRDTARHAPTKMSSLSFSRCSGAALDLLRRTGLVAAAIRAQGCKLQPQPATWDPDSYVCRTRASGPQFFLRECGQF